MSMHFFLLTLNSLKHQYPDVLICYMEYFIICNYISLLSVLGKVEVVSVANGNFTHSGRSKEIKPIENAIVEKIMVKDGAFVKKNDPLVELTVPGVESDILKSEASLLYEKTEQYRYAILSESIQRNELPEIRITDFPGGEDNAGGEHFQRVSSLIKEQS